MWNMVVVFLPLTANGYIYCSDTSWSFFFLCLDEVMHKKPRHGVAGHPESSSDSDAPTISKAWDTIAQPEQGNDEVLK